MVAGDLSNYREAIFRASICYCSDVLRCSKMWDDGFGGIAISVTADAIKSQSTNEFLENCIGEFKAEVDDRSWSDSASPTQSDGEPDDVADR